MRARAGGDGRGKLRRVPDHELDRPLASTAAARPAAHGIAIARKLFLGLAVVLALAWVVSRLNLRRDLHRLDVRILSGAAEGNYHATVAELAGLATARHGRVINVSTKGSLDNVSRLGAAAAGNCDVQFALVQDGSAWGEPGKLELVGRLAKAESLFFLGKDADKLSEFSQLAGLRVGVGPEGSGTSLLAEQFLGLPELASLGMTLSHRPLDEQLAMAARGDLDLAAIVIDEDAPFLVKAIRDQGLQIAGFAHSDVIARRLPHLRTGRIGAGQYEAVRLLPPVDKRVLRVDTLVVANRCAGRSETIDLLILLASHFPDFVRHNKDTPNTTGLELTASSRDFFAHEGPELADEYAPWLVDVMPPANWAYVVMALSLLFNAMGFGHRFRLWRIDAARVALEREITEIFGAGATLGDIQRAAGQADAKNAAALDGIVDRLEELAARSRRYSLSALVPMGQEMAYRYQEDLTYRTIAVLREFRARAAAAVRPAAPGP